jgi:hypothetical protein
MLFLRFDRGLYAYTFLGFTLCIAGWVAIDSLSIGSILGFAIVAASFGLCMKMCKDEDYGYLAGLEHLARRHAGPVINFSLVVLMPIFFILHLVCIVLSLIGLFAGREFTVKAWSRVTERNHPVRARATR